MQFRDPFSKRITNEQQSWLMKFCGYEPREDPIEDLVHRIIEDRIYEGNSKVIKVPEDRVDYIGSIGDPKVQARAALLRNLLNSLTRERFYELSSRGEVQDDDEGCMRTDYQCLHDRYCFPGTEMVTPQPAVI